MQPDGPYRYTHLLGGSPVGKAWAAVDGQGRFVTVAVLDATVAAAQGWREAFAAITNNLAQTGGMPFVYADFSAAAPWVAYPAEAGPGAERLFQALGVNYQPVPTAGSPVSAPPVSAPPVSAPPVSAPPVSAPPVSGSPVSVPPVSGVPQPVSGVPQPVSGVPQPVSGVPQPVSGVPQPISGVPQPVSGSSQPTSPVPVSATAAPQLDPFAAPVRRIQPSTPPRRRTALWLGIVALTLVLVTGVGGLIVWNLPDDGEPTTPVATASSAPLPPAPTSPPQSPGIEPPQAGEWPSDWPRFTPGDHVVTLSDLDGLGFAVKLPAEWSCTPAGRADGYVKYNCGFSSEQGQLGGELIVRSCASPCDEAQQTAMRQNEDAWGLQWMRGGQFAAYADSSQLQIDGERRYGLAVVAYFRSGQSGRIDQQLVLRMTSPIDGAGRLRRVANHLRDTLIF
ncbi:hypothetical protein [Micromonospora andamanensis]|uniref:hypothetical protein n=1 Tax=Micromonospora andamanensis TaxID=1287068 RepID=UPI0019519EA2|nr:hypothetical protein [Micromonospora andamanensis]GIJ40814.1 hypothetical protein Vwe01_41390 [Micromonospora andamanensis]